MIKKRNVLLLIVFLNFLILSASGKDYKKLGLTTKASLEEVTKAYRKLARQWHPDKNEDPHAQQMFEDIDQAYKNIKKEKEKSPQEEKDGDTTWFEYREAISKRFNSIREKQLNHIFMNNMSLFQTVFRLPAVRNFFESNQGDPLIKKIKLHLRISFFKNREVKDDTRPVDIMFNFAEQKNPLLSQTSLCFLLTPQQQLGIVYFEKKNLQYAFVSERGLEDDIFSNSLVKDVGDVVAYEFSPTEKEALVELEYPIYLQKGILSGNYGPDNIYGDEPIFIEKESKTIDMPETSALFDQLNQHLSPAEFLNQLIDYLKNLNSFKKEEGVQSILETKTHPTVETPENKIPVKPVNTWSWKSVLIGTTVLSVMASFLLYYLHNTKKN